jgi:hypothetical protein
VKLFSRVLIGFAMAALPAMCGTFNIASVNGANDWYGIQWFGQGGSITGILPGSQYVSTNGTTILASSPNISNLTDTWTFNFGANVTLTIADMFNDGDQFQLFVDGSAVPSLTTSVPANDNTFCGNDPVICMANVKFSSGSIVLAAGAHTITMKDLAVNNQSPSGMAAFQLSGGGAPPPPPPGVPEPTTLGLMGLGLGGLLLRWRAKRT